VPSEEAPLVTPSPARVVLTVVSTVLTIVASTLTIVSGTLTVVVGVTTDGEVNSIVDRSTLCDWHDNRLMVRSGSDGRHPVGTSGETLGDVGSELSAGGNTIETLEEGKDTWVGGLRRVERCNFFNDNVVVSDNLPSVVQLLRCGVVGVGGVGKGTGLHSVYVHDDGEWCVWLDVTTVKRELKLHGRHVVDAWNITHRCGVARATLNLLAICNGLANAETDEVVGADEGVRFAIGLALPDDGLNDRRVQSEGGLWVATCPITSVVTTIVARVGTSVVARIVTSVVARIVTAVVAGLVVVTAIVAPILTTATAAIVATVLSIAVTAEPVVLTGYKTIELGDKKGDRDLGNGKENERELEALHDFCPDGRVEESEKLLLGRNDGVGSKQASLSKKL
jgi:hypothetical protein